MKVLIISNLYEPYARGGAEAVVKLVAEGLAARGHEVAVLTARPHHSSFLKNLRMIVEEERVGEVRVLRFFPLNIYFTRNDHRYPWPVRFVWRLIDTWNLHSMAVVSRVLAREKPDVVMTHNLVGIGLLTLWMIRRAKIKHVHTLHDVQLVHPSGLLMWGRERSAERSIARRIYEHCTRHCFDSPAVVISPSRWLLDFHTSRGFFPKSKTVVLLNPVHIIARRPSADEASPTEIATLRPVGARDDIRILYAGQLEPHKGVRWLLSTLSLRGGYPPLSLRGGRQTDEAISAEIATLRPVGARDDIRLEVAGSGSLEAEVRKAAAEQPERVVFYGKLTEEALQQKFKEVDVVVVPSLCYENAPRIISEVLGAALPVIASRIGGIPEMIRDGENGFLFEPGNVEEFLRVLRDVKKIVLERAQRVEGLPMTTSRYLDALEGLC